MTEPRRYTPAPLVTARLLVHNLDEVIEMRPAAWKQPGFTWTCRVCIQGNPVQPTIGAAIEVAVTHLDKHHAGWRLATRLSEVSTTARGT